MPPVFTPYARSFGYDGGHMKRRALPKKKETVTNGHLANLRKRVTLAPTEPGVYRWMNEEGTVLYVGKAKNLRNRLRSYVNQKQVVGPWKQSFLQQIADFDVTVTNTEVEALIFETNLIKELRPKYNVLMKDDKNYIYAKVTVQDPFPRVEAARKLEEDGAKYFGPMATGGELWAMLTMLRAIFPFRTCTMTIEQAPPALALSREETTTNNTHSPSPGGNDGWTERGVGGEAEQKNKEQIHIDVVCRHKDRPTPCLDFHIEKCVAPCIGRVTPQEYHQQCIAGVLQFLKGDYESVRPILQERMQKAALEKKFELAAQLRDYQMALDRLEGRQLITDTSGEDSDIIAVAVLSGRADVCLMNRRGGRLIGDLNYSLMGQAEDPAQVLEQFLAQYYEGGAEIPDEILVSADLKDKSVFEEWLSGKKGRKVRIILPARGRKSRLLQLAEKNVLEKSRQREAKWEAEKRNTEAALLELAAVLSLPAPPQRIEGYDISHLGGTETVGSMTVMRGGKAANDQYRSFTIRSLRPGQVDDYRALKEVLHRRLLHLIRNVREEEQRLKQKGITFGKPRASEKNKIAVLTADASSYPPYDILVVRKEESPIGFVWIVEMEGGVLQMMHPLFFDGMKIVTDMPDYIFHRKLLSRATKKVYVVVNALLERTYSALGFQYVQRAPAPLAQRIADHNAFIEAHDAGEQSLVMVYDPKKNKPDPSLSARPDLLVIDGGKGQLSAALEILALYKLDIPVIGLAKREEEVFVPPAGEPDSPGGARSVAFPADSPAKFLLMRLRDEAHRFANRHREKRQSKTSKLSRLDSIPGIGPETRKILLQRFGSLTGIREAKDEELLGILSEFQLKELRRRL